MADSVQILRTCDAFRGLGHEVTLFACAGDVDAQCMRSAYGLSHDLVVSLGSCPSRLERLPRVGRLARSYHVAKRVWKSMPFDAVYGRDAYVLSLLARSGLPLIFEAHEMPGFYERKVLRWLFNRPNFRRLVVITDALRKDYLSAFRCLQKKELIVVPCGVALALLDAPENPASNIGGRQGAMQVGYVGALYPGKGMEIIAQVASRMPMIDFHIVGGRPQDIIYWKERKLTKNVIFHGLKTHVQVPTFIDAFDVVLLPSQSVIRSFAGTGNIGRWTSPMKMFEYMARGKAIIASDLPVLLEVIEHGKTGLVARADDPGSWIERLCQLLVDKNLRSELGNGAREKCRSMYTAEACSATRIEGILK